MSLEVGVRCNVVAGRPKPGKDVILVENDPMSSMSFDLGVTTALPLFLGVGVPIAFVCFFVCTKICAGLGFSAPIG